MESKHFREEFAETMKGDSELMKSIEDMVMLNESYAGPPNKNIPFN